MVRVSFDCWDIDVALLQYFVCKIHNVNEELCQIQGLFNLSMLNRKGITLNGNVNIWSNIVNSSTLKKMLLSIGLIFDKSDIRSKLSLTFNAWFCFRSSSVRIYLSGCGYWVV